MRVGSLFSGIGGLEFGLERAGMEVAWQVEADPYCQAILNKHWPEVPTHDDVYEVSGESLDPVDLICGGFPCQPISAAGRRQAQADPRWLWPQFARLVDELRPRYVLVENVPGLWSTTGGAEVVSDLATLGYDCRWDRLFAASVGAPHLRERVFIVAYRGEGSRERAMANANLSGPQGQKPAGRRNLPAGGGSSRGTEEVANPNRRHGWPWDLWQRGWAESANGSQPSRWPGDPANGPEPVMGRMVARVPNRMDRLRTLGNAVVPQVAEVVGRYIMEMDLDRDAMVTAEKELR